MRQKKRLIIFLVLVSLGALWGCGSNKKQEPPAKLSMEIPTVFKEQFKKLNLLHYAKGNFTGSGKDEYIVFYEDLLQRYEPDQRNINKIMIFAMIDTGRPKLYEINDSSLGPYDEWELRIITNKKLHFGQWDGYCRIADYNGNGLDEVMFFGAGGSGFFVTIYEYKNGKMERILESFSLYSIAISGVETIIEKNKKYIKIYGTEEMEKPGEKIPEGYREIGISITGIKKRANMKLLRMVLRNGNKMCFNWRCQNHFQGA
jgi:hypothetical protein